MSDARLRELERRARSGDVQAEAHALGERLRTGTLTRDRLELAAYCGDRAARLAHGDRIFGSGAEAGIVDLSAWVRGLDRWETSPQRTIGVRAALGACLATWHALVPGHALQRPFHQRSYGAGSNRDGACLVCDGLDEPRIALVTAQAWLACPCDWHAEACTAAGQHAGEVVRWWGMLTATVAGSERAGDSRPSGARCALLCLGVLQDANVEAADLEVRRGIRTELVGWALGGQP